MSCRFLAVCCVLRAVCCVFPMLLCYRHLMIDQCPLGLHACSCVLCAVPSPRTVLQAPNQCHCACTLQVLAVPPSIIFITIKRSLR